MLLRLQAKRQTGQVYQTFYEESGRVAKAASELQQTKCNTVIPTSFLVGRLSSWQAHLTRISPYLILGCNVWWKCTSLGYEFLHGSEESADRHEGPGLSHYRAKSLDEVYKEKKYLWKELMDTKTDLPTPYVTLYSEKGEPLGRHYYNTDKEHTESDATMDMSNETDKQIDEAESEEHLTMDSGNEKQNHLDREKFDKPIDSDTEEQIVVEDELQHEGNESPTTELVNDTEEPAIADQARTQEPAIADQVMPQGSVTLHTQLGTTLAQVLGATKDVVDLDTARHSLKTKPGCTNQNNLIKQHKHLISKLSKNLLAMKIDKKREINSYEQAYFLRHNMLPNETNKDYQTLLHEYKKVNKLLLHGDFTRSK